jgi:hypothetical protein
MVQYIILIAIGLVDLDTDTVIPAMVLLSLPGLLSLPDLPLSSYLVYVPICIITNLATLGWCRYPQGR